MHSFISVVKKDLIVSYRGLIQNVEFTLKLVPSSFTGPWTVGEFHRNEKSPSLTFLLLAPHSRNFVLKHSCGKQPFVRSVQQLHSDVHSALRTFQPNISFNRKLKTKGRKTFHWIFKCVDSPLELG